jgi:site-specific recombinase XerD
MRKGSLPFHKLPDLKCSLPCKRFKIGVESWLLDCEIRQVSEKTLALRRLVTKNFIWWLEREEIAEIDTLSLRSFMAYIIKGHENPEGRWGNPQEKNPVKSGTVSTYHRHLRALLNWLTEEGEMDVSPMERVTAPIDRPDDIIPFETHHIEALYTAARQTLNATRDVAIISMLLDTGIRLAELAGLKYQDIDHMVRSCIVEGKGGKKRKVYYGRHTAKALWNYLKHTSDIRIPESPLFYCTRGTGHKEALTERGIQMLLRRLGASAKITGVRVSPHTFRHTFAIQFLRSGGNQFTLMQILGHTNVRMTSRYVQIAQADVEQQQRLHSPVDIIHKRKK